jgi:hypothetical protein
VLESVLALVLVSVLALASAQVSVLVPARQRPVSR